MSASHHSETMGETLSYPEYPQQQSAQQTWQGGEPPLWAPSYGAPFPVAVKRFFKKYATFSGRASRSEYWWWTLVAVVIGIIVNIIISAGTTSASPLSSTPQYGPGAVIGLILAVIW